MSGALLLPLQYFGRVVPVILRTFPTLQAYKIELVKHVCKESYSDKVNEAKKKHDPLKDILSGSNHIEGALNEPENNQKSQLSGVAIEPAFSTDSRNCSKQEKKLNFRNSHDSYNKTTIIPGELEGQLNMILFGFRKRHLLKEMFSWYPLGRTMFVEMDKKYDRDNLFQCYTVFIFPRWCRLFNFWFCWRYKKLIRAYATNKIKVRETRKLQSLAKGAGLEDATQYQNLTGPIPLSDTAVDEFGEQLDENDRNGIMEKRQRAFNEYCQVKKDVRQSWQFADKLISHTFIAYTNRKAFIDSLQLPDKQRSYSAVVNREGRLFWFGHEKCTIQKANDMFDRFKLDHMKIQPEMLPRNIDIRTKLYGRCPDVALPQLYHPKVPQLKKNTQKSIRS